MNLTREDWPFVLKESCKLIGLAVVATVLFAALIVVTPGCNTSGTTTGPDTTVSAPAPAPAPAAAATPAPAPVATPVPITPDKAWDVWGTTKGVLHVKYTGEATYAQYLSYYTAIDSYAQIAEETREIKRGDEQTRPFDGTCIQVDVEQIGVKPVGHVFFDKDGIPFDQHKNPEKLAACRKGPECPEGYELRNGICVKKDTLPFDACPNLDGTQSSVPEGYTYNEETGQCDPIQCTESKDPVQIPGAVYWGALTGGQETIVDGKCDPEVLPLPIPSVSEATTTLNCHTTGQQQIIIDYLCQENGSTTRDLCKNVACACVNVPTTRLDTTYGEYGQCSIETGKKSRTKTVKTYTTNSCTKVEELTNTEVTTDSESCTCSGYTKPTFSGGLSVVLAEPKYSITSSVTPTGGTFSPVLPVNAALGAAFTFNTTYTKSYGYAPLQCTAAAPFSVSVPAGHCYYNVKHDDEQKCKAQSGASWNEGNHLCSLPFPGISNDDFNLNPGQSAASCYDKHD
jgi:hypothetical protein